MSTITLPRAVVAQALEFLDAEFGWSPGEAPRIDALRAALEQQAEPRNQCRSDGRCQYAIDHGAEGIGHCPKGKCVMAQHTQPAEDRDVAQSNLRVMKEMFREQTEPAQQAEAETCTWQQDGDSDSGVYGTSCRRYFSLDDGTPEDNRLAWCCYCGKRLVQELITEDEDE